MLERLFPAGVVVVEATTAMWEAPLHPDEARYVEDAVGARRRDFAAGRASAREALARLGSAQASLGRGPDRAPRWPAGIVGSISHCPGFCAAAAARTTDAAGLGLDIEQPGRVGEALLRRIATPAERDWIAAQARGDEAAAEGLRTVLFSAKEAIYKCVAPALGLRLTWAQAELEVDVESGTFVAALEHPAAGGELPARLDGRFECRKDRVAVGVALPPQEA